MKVTAVRSIILSYSYEHAISDALNSFSTRNAVIVFIDTDEGITGVGEAACFGGPPTTTKYIIDSELSKYVIGEDPTDVEKIWNRMWYGCRQHGRRGLTQSAISGIDVALWDIIGKKANLPLYKMLGAYTNKLRPYASSGFYQYGKGPKELAEEVESYIEQGFKYIKIKVGRTPEEILSPTNNMPSGDYCTCTLEEDMERVEACYNVAKGKAKLMVDVNNAWTPSLAIQMGREFEKMGIYWIEEPVHVDNIRGSAQVARALDIPIAGYESESGLYGMRDLILAQAVDIVQPDVVWSGGITECLKIAGLAAAFNMPVIPHVFSSGVSLVANMHFIASLSNGHLLEFDRNIYPLRDDLLMEPICMNEEGYVMLPDKPGLGIELNESIIKKYLIAE